MKLKEFKAVLDKIPTMYDNVEMSFICNGKAYSIEDTDNIEWYEDDMNNNKKMVDITVG